MYSIITKKTAFFCLCFALLINISQGTAVNMTKELKETRRQRQEKSQKPKKQGLPLQQFSSRQPKQKPGSNICTLQMLQQHDTQDFLKKLKQIDKDLDNNQQKLDKIFKSNQEIRRSHQEMDENLDKLSQSNQEIRRSHQEMDKNLDKMHENLDKTHESNQEMEEGNRSILQDFNQGSLPDIPEETTINEDLEKDSLINNHHLFASTVKSHHRSRSWVYSAYTSPATCALVWFMVGVATTTLYFKSKNKNHPKKP